MAHLPAAARVLVASEDRALNSALARLLAAYQPDVDADGSASVLAAVEQRPALRLLVMGDLRPDSLALDLLESVKQRRPKLSVLVLSSHPAIDQATESIRRGAEDFVPIPYSEELVLKEVARILEAAELRDRVDEEREGNLTYVESQGRRLFIHYCATCHGDEARGDGQNASNLNPAPPDMTASTASRDPALIRRVIAEGSAAVGRSPLSPPWGRSLSQQQIDYLVAYCQSIGRKKP
jgi:FixJ family two-component response regulator